MILENTLYKKSKVMLKIVGIELLGNIWNITCIPPTNNSNIFQTRYYTLMTIPLALVKEKYYQFLLYQTRFKEASKMEDLFMNKKERT